MCAIKPEPSVYSEQTLPPCHEPEFCFLIPFSPRPIFGEEEGGKAVEVAAAMVFCVSCGNKLAGLYCGQCGGDSQLTTDAQSEVPVLTIPSGTAKKKESFSKTSTSRKVGKSAARDALKGKGSAVMRRKARAVRLDVLHEVHKLQHKNAISAYLFNLGLDDQNPEFGMITK